MNKEKHLRAIGSKYSQALQASIKLCDIISEKYLADILPETKQISMEELNQITIYNYISLRKYLGNNYYRVAGKNIDVIADNQFLSEQAKNLCKRLILKLVTPSQFDKDSFENRVQKYIMDIDFTADEREFIDLMLNELLSIANIKECSSKISTNDLLNFNLLNHNSFYYNARKVYNDILQKKLHAGDNIILYFADNLTASEIAYRLQKAEKFDYFFNKHGILKCDLQTNRNILIKNFLNSVIYSFNDPYSRATLLLKLNEKYPILIK